MLSSCLLRHLMKHLMDIATADNTLAYGQRRRLFPLRIKFRPFPHHNNNKEQNNKKTNKIKNLIPNILIIIDRITHFYNFACKKLQKNG